MPLSGPDCAKAVYGQVTMAFPGGNIIEEAPEEIAAALALVAANQPGGIAVAVRIRVTDANGNILNCCPDGFGFDSVAGYCKLLPPKPAPPPPPPTPPPAPGPPPSLGDGNGDELTIGVDSILLELEQIILLLKQLTGDGSKPIDYTQCCHAISLGIAALVKVANQISVKLSAPGAPPPPPLDLTAVIAELTCACDNLTAISSSSATVASNLGPGLKSIANAITNQTGTDVSKIVEQLKAIVFEGDIPKPFIDAMVSEGFLSAADGQQLTGSPWSPAIARIFRTAGWNALVWWMAGVGYTWDGKNWVLGGSGNIASRAVATAASKGITAEDFIFLPTVKAAVQALSALITPKTPGDVGEEVVDPDKFLTRAVSIIVDAFLVNYGLHLCDALPGEGLTKLLETLTGLLGLEEMRDVQIGPLIQYGPARVAQYKAKNLYRQELPGIGALSALHARGLIDMKTYQDYQGFTGVPWRLVNAEREAGYTGLPPFILLRLASTGLFTQRDLVDELTFRGVRPESQHRILLAAPYIETAKEREALRGTLEKGYAQGFFADADFTTRIEQIEQITDKSTLIMDKVRLERAFAGAKDLENAYETEFLAGITDVPQYQSKLAGLGLQPDYVAYLMAKAEAHANARLMRQAAAAERALAKATAAEERRAAMTQYQAGTIDEPRLAGLLIGTGLTPLQAAAWIAQAQGQRAGKLRFQFGLRLSPAEATLLRQKVADLTRQRELQMLTDGQYVAGLTALKIPQTWLNALRAGANAALKPKTAAILTPVATP